MLHLKKDVIKAPVADNFMRFKPFILSLMGGILLSFAPFAYGLDCVHSFAMVPDGQVLLRPLEPADLKSAKEILQSDHFVNATGIAFTDDQVRNMVNGRSKHHRASRLEVLDYAIVDSVSGNTIGVVGIEARNGQPGVGDLFYAIHPNALGRGYASQAVEKLVTDCFQKQEFSLVRARIRADNLASQRVVENQGFIRTKTLEVPQRREGIVIYYLYERTNVLELAPTAN